MRFKKCVFYQNIRALYIESQRLQESKYVYSGHARLTKLKNERLLIDEDNCRCGLRSRLGD